MLETVSKIKKVVTSPSSPFINDPSYSLSMLYKAPDLASLIWEVKLAMEKGVQPERLTYGSTEIYLMRNREGVPLAIFKPTQDEADLKEYAAFRLDHRHFAGIPPLVIATFSHSIFGEARKGSFQPYLADGKRVMELDRESLPTLNATSIRRIAAFDIRMINCDRHTSNLLTKNRDLIPIDHGLILPTKYFGLHLCWRDWGQAKTCFSQEEASYIESLDPQADREILLKELRIKRREADLHYIATSFLKYGVKYRLTPYDLSSALVQHPEAVGTKKNWTPSFFERALQNIQGDSTTEWFTFASSVEEEMGRLIHETCQRRDKEIDCRI